MILNEDNKQQVMYSRHLSNMAENEHNVLV